jgi:tRNA threonylcarbamoyl adenosine modification protein (Sua5/YciO/YrdC/YwlC family)
VTDALDRAVEAALSGRLVVIPTDTVYGIGTRPDDATATARVFEAKGRPRELTLPVLVASVSDAERVAVFDARARALAGSHWPGALTIVLPRSDESGGWDLGDETDSIGVRVPDHALARAVLERTGPLAVTSANRSGEPTPGSCDELLEIFGDAVEVYVCQEEAPPGLASTVVDLTGDARVLRSGAVALGPALDAAGRRD